QNADRPLVGVDDLAIADRVLHPAQRMNARCVAADAPFRRRLGQFDHGNQVADRRIRSGEVDAGGLADQAATAVAPDEVARPHRRAFGQLDIDAIFVLSEADHLAPAIDWHLEVLNPAGEDALDVALPQPETVGMPGRKITEVEMDPGKPCDLRLLPLGDEPIGNAALVEHLDGARVQASGARAQQLLALPPFDDSDIDAREGQLAGQHQPGRAAAGDRYLMLELAHFVTP